MSYYCVNLYKWTWKSFLKCPNRSINRTPLRLQDDPIPSSRDTTSFPTASIQQTVKPQGKRLTKQSQSFLTFDTMCRCVVSVTPPANLSARNSPTTNWTKEWDPGPAGRVWKRGVSGMLSGIKPQVFSCINHKLITTMTELISSWKQRNWHHSKNRMKLLKIPWPRIPSGI